MTLHLIEGRNPRKRFHQQLRLPLQTNYLPTWTSSSTLKADHPNERRMGNRTARNRLEKDGKFTTEVNAKTKTHS
jgi:hypothetical protein